MYYPRGDSSIPRPAAARRASSSTPGMIWLTLHVELIAQRHLLPVCDNDDDDDDDVHNYSDKSLPVYPGEQWQVYILTPSTHVAPFWHAWCRQSLDGVVQLADTSSQPTRRHHIT